MLFRFLEEESSFQSKLLSTISWTQYIFTMQIIISSIITNPRYIVFVTPDSQVIWVSSNNVKNFLLWLQSCIIGEQTPIDLDIYKVKIVNGKRLAKKRKSKRAAIYDDWIPINFSIPFGQPGRQVELVTSSTTRMRKLVSLWATSDILLPNCHPRDHYIWTDTKKCREIVGTGISREILKICLKLLYGVDISYRRPYSTDLYLKVWRAADKLRWPVVHAQLTDFLEEEQNVLVSFLVDVPDKKRLAWLKEKCVADILEMADHPEYIKRQGDMFSDEAARVMFEIYRHDYLRPEGSVCKRCKAEKHATDKRMVLFDDILNLPSIEHLMRIQPMHFPHTPLRYLW